MKFKDLDIKVRANFVKEVLLEFYPFTEEDLEDLESKLDFRIISKNQSIDWNSTILKKYTDKWDWTEIENNPIICKEVNLGLLFPGLVKMSKPECNCHKELDYCNMDKYCNGVYDRVKMRRKPRNPLNPDLQGYIEFLIDEKVINNDVMSNIILYNMLINYGGDNEVNLENNSTKSTNDYEDLPF